MSVAVELRRISCEMSWKKGPREGDVGRSEKGLLIGGLWLIACMLGIWGILCAS